MAQLSAITAQTRETQLALLYDVFGFQLVIARYDVLSTLHDTGPCALTNISMSFSGQYMLVMQLLMAAAIILNILVIHVHFQGTHAWKVPLALRDFFFYRIGPWIKMSNNIAKCKTNQARVRHIKIV